jgi:uncharacterized protein YbjT (DUF2867 family)
VLRLLQRDGAAPVVCLTRDPERLAAAVPPADGWSYLRGDLDAPEGYEDHLREGGTVLHLGSSTGAASAERHRAVIVDGTRELLARCARRGTGKFVFVSSIAAKFTDQRHYHYARAKLEAEALVRRSGLPYLIVRPTMVLGRGSAVLAGLQKLATTPAAVVFGSGRALVQPIHVDDLAALIARLVREEGPVEPRTIEAGGPEALPIGELVRRIRRRATGRTGPVVHLPARAVQSLLALAEPVLGAKLPLRAGQLSSFLNDAIAERHPLTDPLLPHLAGIDSMLSTLEIHA